MEAAITSLYKDPSSPAAFSTTRNVYRAARQQGLDVSLEQVKKVVEKIPTYSLHKPRRFRYKSAATIAYSIDYSWSADLADMSHLYPYNRPIKWLLGKKKKNPKATITNRTMFQLLWTI